MSTGRVCYEGNLASWNAAGAFGFIDSDESNGPHYRSRCAGMGWKFVIVATATALCTCACSSSSPDSEPEKSSTTWPLCSEAFIEGRKIPDDAPGCVDGNGHRERYGRFECTSGPPILTYAEDTWTENGVVVEDNGDEFAAALEECQGKDG
jgi:hypothetical protein